MCWSIKLWPEDINDASITVLAFPPDPTSSVSWAAFLKEHNGLLEADNNQVNIKIIKPIHFPSETVLLILQSQRMLQPSHLEP